MSRWDEVAYDRDRWDAPHSGPGIASFIIFMGGAVLVTLMIVIGVVIGSSSGRNGFNNGAVIFLIGGGVILGFILDLASLGLGIGGMCQSNRKKVFAILGTVFSGITLFAALVLILMGLVYSR